LACALVLFPAIGRTNSAAALIDAVPALSAGRPLVTVDVRVPSLTFYLDRPVEVVDSAQLGGRLAQDDRPLFVFIDVDLPAVPAGVAQRLNEFGRYGKYIVFEERQSMASGPDNAKPD
jgi:hypothetical protein